MTRTTATILALVAGMQFACIQEMATYPKGETVGARIANDPLVSRAEISTCRLKITLYDSGLTMAYSGTNHAIWSPSPGYSVCMVAKDGDKTEVTRTKDGKYYWKGKRLE